MSHRCPSLAFIFPFLFFAILVVSFSCLDGTCFSSVFTFLFVLNVFIPCLYPLFFFSQTPPTPGYCFCFVVGVDDSRIVRLFNPNPKMFATSYPISPHLKSSPISAGWIKPQTTSLHYENLSRLYNPFFPIILTSSQSIAAMPPL